MPEQTFVEYKYFVSGFCFFCFCYCFIRRWTIWEYIFCPKLLLNAILNVKFREFIEKNLKITKCLLSQFTFLYWNLKNILSTLTPFNFILNNLKVMVCYCYLIFIILLYFSFTSNCIMLFAQATSIIFQNITALHLVTSHK